MSIVLQGTVDFSDDFRRRLPLIEQAMRESGLDPESFIISKDNAATSNARPLGPFFYDYTVFVDGESFTITEPNDTRFLDYFAARIVGATHPADRRRRGMFARFLRWMSRPVLRATDDFSSAPTRPTSRTPR